MLSSQLCRFQHPTRGCWQDAARRCSSSCLPQLLRHTATHAERIELPELYKVGVLLKDPSDPLGLRGNTAFLEGLSARYQQLRDAATPFQVSLLDAVLPRADAGASSPAASSQVGGVGGDAVVSSGKESRPSTLAAAAPVTAQDYYKAIMEIAKEVEFEHGQAAAQDARQQQSREYPSRSYGTGSAEQHTARGQRPVEAFIPSGKPKTNSVSDHSRSPALGETLGSARAATLEAHLTSLEPLLRQLSPAETFRLIKTLAKLNYSNYEHTVLLTRRGCEVAAHLQRRDLCTLFSNLHRLHTRDSLVPIVNRILEHVQELTAAEVLLLCTAIEKQENNSTATQRLLSPLIIKAVSKLPDATSSAYHRALLVSMARYQLRQPSTVQLILRDWVARWKTTSSEKDVLVLLEAAVTLAEHGTESEGMKELIDRLTFLAPSMDLRNLDTVMYLLSTVSMDLSASCMHIFLTRLENESGMLSVGQLKFLLQMLSTYPPAKGHVAMVSLAYASAIRAKAMDAESLESIVLSLAAVHLFTDDFFCIAQVLQLQKGGMRSFQHAQELFESCTAEMAATARGLGMLTSVVHTLAVTLSDEELAYFRRALMRLGVKDREVLQQIFTTAKRLQRGAAKASSSASSRKPRRGGYYDPMADLL